MFVQSGALHVFMNPAVPTGSGRVTFPSGTLTKCVAMTPVWPPPTSSQPFSGPLLVNPTSSSRQAAPSWEGPRQKRRFAPWTSRHSTGLRPARPVWGGRKGRNRRPWCWCCPGRGRASRSACRGRQRVFSSCLRVQRNFYFCSQLSLCYSYTAVRQIGSGSYR